MENSFPYSHIDLSRGKGHVERIRNGNRALAMAIFGRIEEDIRVIMDKDPAARSRAEVFFCYPGFHTLLFHRTAQAAWGRT